MVFLYQLYMRLRLFAEKHDLIYSPLIKTVALARPRQWEVLVRSDTDIVIEGFPRSANTFFYFYFKTAQENGVNIAHHLHSSYQIRYSSRNNIPCIFLIRPPLPAITSALLRDKRQSARNLCKSYLDIYREALRLSHDIMVVRYEMATREPNTVISEINKRYGTSYAMLEEGRLPEVTTKIEKAHLTTWKLKTPDPTKLALPSPEKFKLRAEVAEAIERKYASLLQDCQRLYEQLAAYAIVST